MNKNNVIAILLALVILALLGSGAAAYMFYNHQLDVANYRAQSAEQHTVALEKQVTDLTETAQVCDERGREISSLRNKTAELEKQIADLKNQTGNPATLTWRGNWQQPAQVNGDPAVILGGINAITPNEQLFEQVKRLQADLNVNTPGTVRVLTNGVEGNFIVHTIPNTADNIKIELAAPPADAGLPAAAGAPPEPTRLETTRRIRTTRRLQAEQQAEKKQIEAIIEETKPIPPAKKGEPGTEQF